MYIYIYSKILLRSSEFRTLRARFWASTWCSSFCCYFGLHRRGQDALSAILDCAGVPRSPGRTFGGSAALWDCAGVAQTHFRLFWTEQASGFLKLLLLFWSAQAWPRRTFGYFGLRRRFCYYFGVHRRGPDALSADRLCIQRSKTRSKSLIVRVSLWPTNFVLPADRLCILRSRTRSKSLIVRASLWSTNFVRLHSHIQTRTYPLQVEIALYSADVCLSELAVPAVVVVYCHPPKVFIS